MTEAQTNAQSMLMTHPAAPADTTDLAAVIEAVAACAQACTTCADACLHEDSVAEMRECIRSDQDCADLCFALLRILSRPGSTNTAILAAALSACVAACAACASECGSHADMHEHCRACAEACRRCESACRRMLEDLG